MRITALIFVAVLLGACSQTDDDRARADAEKAKEQAHQTTEQLKRESNAALHDAEVGAKKASKEIDRGLENARDKMRQSIDEHRAPHADDDTTRH